jgi:hypothetical protein
MEYFIQAVNSQFEEEAKKYPTITGITTRDIERAVDA